MPQGFRSHVVGGSSRAWSKGLSGTLPETWPWPSRIDFAPYRKLLEHGIHTQADIALANELLRKLSPEFGRMLDAAEKIKVFIRDYLPEDNLGFATPDDSYYLGRRQRGKFVDIHLKRGAKIPDYLHELEHYVRFEDLPEFSRRLFPKDLVLDPRHSLAKLSRDAVRDGLWDEVLAFSSEVHLLQKLKEAGYWIRREHLVAHGFIKKVGRAYAREGGAGVYNVVSDYEAYQASQRESFPQAIILKSRVGDWDFFQRQALNYGIVVHDFAINVDSEDLSLQGILEFALARRGVPLVGIFLGLFQSSTGMLLERVHGCYSGGMSSREIANFLSSDFEGFAEKVGEVFFSEPRSFAVESEDFEGSLLRAELDPSPEFRRERYRALVETASRWNSPVVLPQSERNWDEILLRQRHLFDLALILWREGEIEQGKACLNRACAWISRELWERELKDWVANPRKAPPRKEIFSLKHLPLRELVELGFDASVRQWIFSRMSGLSSLLAEIPTEFVGVERSPYEAFWGYEAALVEAIQVSDLVLSEEDGQTLRFLIGDFVASMVRNLQAEIPVTFAESCLKVRVLFETGLSFLKYFPEGAERLRLFASAAENFPEDESVERIQVFVREYREALETRAKDSNGEGYENSHDYFWHQTLIVNFFSRHPEMGMRAVSWLRKPWSESFASISHEFDELDREVPWAGYRSPQPNPTMLFLQSHAGEDWSRLRKSVGELEYSVPWNIFQPVLWKAEFLIDCLELFPPEEREGQLERVEDLLFRAMPQGFACLKKAELYWRLAKAAYRCGHDRLLRRLLQAKAAVFHVLGLRILREESSGESGDEGCDFETWQRTRDYYDRAFSFLSRLRKRFEMPRDVRARDVDLAIDLLQTLNGKASSDFVRDFAAWTIDRYADSLLFHRDRGASRSIAVALGGLHLSDPECDELWTRLILRISPEPGVLRQTHWRGRAAWEFYRVLDFVLGNTALPNAARLLKERVDFFAESERVKNAGGLEAIGWLRLLAWIRGKESAA